MAKAASAIAVPASSASLQCRDDEYSAAVTAEFDLNALPHLNRRLGADFDVRRFVHRAVWVDAEQRIEMRLRSLCEQVVHLRGHSIEFARNEELITEYCHKYSPEQFETIAGAAGLDVRKQWTDEQWRFSVQLLEPGEGCRQFEAGKDVKPCARSGRRIAF